MFDAEQNTFNYDFGIRLEAARMALRLSPNEMCELLDCARSTYTQYIRGNTMITPYRLSPLYKCGVSSDYLFFGDKRNLSNTVAMSIEGAEVVAKSEREKPENRGRRT
ncbi:helix-turn-helix domain-containing protein [Azospirillum cavernae]|uniref:helix-turn-helix domain-containing protein n=1 Tax=Azospirillum cavernae TaxID=2320860 RepID=UPI0011C46FE5|nr:helix-turn-helix transcriptional regulator [Azospirillum cavernae]